jgi:PAS domain S-box-containing protein
MVEAPSGAEMSIESERAADALRESEEHYRAVAEAATDAIITIDSDSTILIINPATERIFGYASEEMIGQPLTMLMPEVLRRLHTAGIVRYMQTGRKHIHWSAVQLPGLHKTGNEIPLEISFAEFTRDGRRFFTGIARDISERRRLQDKQARLARHAVLHAEVSAAVSESEKSLRATLQICAAAVVSHLDAAFARIWLVNEELKVLELEASAGLYTHLDGGHARIPLGSFKIGLIATEQKPHLTNSVQSDDRVSNKGWAQREGMISFAGYPLLVEGRTVGVIALFARQSLELDTIEALESVAPIIAQGVERKRTQETLRQMQAELAHLNRVMTVGELTASIAHEINQPLAAIVMNGNAALRWLALDPPNLVRARDSAELIIRDGDRASQIISRIRALLKKSPPSKTLLDINEFVNEAVGLTHNEMVRNSVRLRVDHADDLPRVPGDRIQLQQVLLNLIINAVEAMLTIEDRQRGLLIATDIFDNTGVRIAVTDNGLGIDPQTADHLFDAFSTTKPEGMGMGLAISRSIIEAHGGRLWTEPNHEYGATFQFTLPMAANES